MRCPARRWMPEGAVSAAYSLTRKLSSSRPLSSARIAVITLVVLAGGSGSVEFRSQTTSPVPASMMTAARAVMYGPAARPGAGTASANPSANTAPAVLISRILHPLPGSAIIPTGDYSHVKARGSSKMRSRGIRRGAERCRRAQGPWGEHGGGAGSHAGEGAHPARDRGLRRAAQHTLARQIGHAAAGILHRQLEDRRQPAKGRMPRNRDQPMADALFPRHLMSVPAAPDRPLAVVQMERHQPLEEPLAAQRVRQAVPRLGPRQVEPRRVQMAGVDEDAQAVGGRAHVAYQPAHLGHVGAELAA